MTKTLRIVCICSGNICRSPLAEALARKLLAEAKIPAVVISAGTLGIQGRPAARHTVSTAAEIGLDVSSHRSQGVSMPLMRMADRLIIMAPQHEEALLRQDPSLASKIVRLWEYARDEERPTLAEIPDPVSQDIAVFRRARALIEDGLNAWVAALKDPGAQPK